jgi:hypothetical protein
VTPFGEDNPHGFVLVTPVGGPFAIAEEDAGLLRPCRLSKYVSFFYQNHIAAETVKHLRKDIRLYRISPISGTAEPAMSKVHGSDSCLLKTA